MGREVVQHHMYAQASGRRSVHLFKKRQHVSAGVTLATVGDDLARADVQGREKVDCAVALVVMGHGASPARAHGQRGLRAVERLHLGLFVETEKRRSLRWAHLQPDDIDHLLLEAGVVGD
ncbi:MAG TPA: hypothetical protein VME46_04565, partial [Acidimicrobiales bacterium]|nr:hypothetical protein [Acidimicrobiales bacterium]